MTDTPSDTTAETTPTPRRPHWWPAIALAPIALLALVALLHAAAPTGGDSRVFMIVNGMWILPIGVLIYVWLLSTISPVRHPRARDALAGLTTAVTLIGGGLFFGSTFLAPHHRGALAFYDMDPAGAFAAMGFLACVVWGLVLLVAVVLLAILARAADVGDEREGREAERPSPSV